MTLNSYMSLMVRKKITKLIRKEGKKITRIKNVKHLKLVLKREEIAISIQII